MDHLVFPVGAQQAEASEKRFSGFPRPVREVHQIELTTHCNLRCKYCPSPNLPRAKDHMTWETWSASLGLVEYFIRKGTQTELSLTGIGEPLLHPNFVEMVASAREVLGPDRPLVVSTNGLLVTDELVEKIKPYNPRVFVSTHRPEKAGPAGLKLHNAGLLAGINTAFVNAAFNWAGQVDWYVAAPELVCEYLRAGWCVIMQDGRITSCCLDASGAGVIGTVWDLGKRDSLAMKPYSLCSSCHMRIPEEDYL